MEEKLKWKTWTIDRMNISVFNKAVQLSNNKEKPSSPETFQY